MFCVLEHWFQFVKWDFSWGRKQWGGNEGGENSGEGGRWRGGESDNENIHLQMLNSPMEFERAIYDIWINSNTMNMDSL